MRERKSASTNGEMTAGRLLLFRVLCLLLRGVQLWPRGLSLRLWVQISLRSLFLGSPRLPLPHEMGWKHPFLPPRGSRSGGISETGRRRAGGPGARGPRGRPGRSCGLGLFPSRRLRGVVPSWDPGAVCSVLSVRFSAGRKARKTPPVSLKETGLPPGRALSFFPKVFGFF